MSKFLSLLIIIYYLQEAILTGTSITACNDKAKSTMCEKYKAYGYCKTMAWMKTNCKKTCSLCGSPPSSTTLKPSPNPPSTTVIHTTTISLKTKYPTTTMCKDKIDMKRCFIYKSVGYCNSNTWVQINCRKTCNLCGTTPPTKPPNTNRTTKIYPSLAPGSCGISIVKEARVIAGETSNIGQWPWQVALLRNGLFFCGGSLITPEWVLTAAHCVAKSGIIAASLKVILGELHRSQSSGNEQTIRVRKIIKHSAFNKADLNNDIALLKLSQPARLNAHVRTVCLPQSGQHVAVGSKCFISGWGKIRHPGGSVNQLQHTYLSTINKTECIRNNLKYGPITDMMLCAKSKSPSRQSGCHGDSGGPFVCQGKDNSWTLHGVVSWGSTRCDIDDASDVFARVSAFRHWIDDNMKRN